MSMKCSSSSCSHTRPVGLWGAEYHRTDVIALDLSLHVEEVHALHAVAVRLQGLVMT